MIHLPTWTYFRIEADKAVFLRTAEIGGANQEMIDELSAIAMGAFRTIRPGWEPRSCRHPPL
jgi:hypothetical protein